MIKSVMKWSSKHYYSRLLMGRASGVLMNIAQLPQPQVIEGAGSREQVAALCRSNGYSRVLIITDQVLRRLGYLDKLTKGLDAANVSYAVFDGVLPDPGSSMIEKGIAIGLELGAQAVVCLGGGSVMDTGKIVAAGLKRPGLSINQLLAKILVIRGGTLPMINIPSTSGTGAELTVGAVITNEQKHEKHLTMLTSLRVAAVILDIELTMGAPAGITAACGIDALSHGVDGYLSAIKRSGENGQWCIRCVQTAMKQLPLVLREPQNQPARLEMSRAALYGGRTINLQICNYIHSFAHSLGAIYHIPHGQAIALAMPPVLEYQLPYCCDKLAHLARACELTQPGMSTEQQARAFIDAVRQLIVEAGIPLTSAALKQDDYERIIAHVFLDSVNYSVPKVMTRPDVIHILDQIRA